MSHGPQKNLWVLALDGSKALIYRNEGDAQYPVLKPVEIEHQDVPQRQDLITDRPGRMSDGNNHRSAMDEVDAHDQMERRFAEDAIEHLNQAALKNELESLLIYAASHSLGEIRPHYHVELEKRIVGEFDLDVVNEPVDKLEKRVSKALEDA